jgi:hypothetical protein
MDNLEDDEEGYARGWDLFKWKWIAEPPLSFSVPVAGVARFEGAYLNGTIFTDATMSDASVDGADLSNVRGLTQEQIEQTWGDERTRLPSNLSRPINDRWIDQSTPEELRKSRNDRWWTLWNQSIGRPLSERGAKLRPGDLVST